MTRRVLLVAATTGYQTRAFDDAAGRAGIELVLATDRCGVLDDPWRDDAIPIRFHEEEAAVEAIRAAIRDRPIDGVLAVGDRPTVIAARVAEAAGLPWHSSEGARVARHKRLAREWLREVGLPVPWFVAASVNDAPDAIARRIRYPAVIKPVALSGSRGVMRVDDRASFERAFARLRALLAAPEVRAERDREHDTILVEGFIPGREFALEGLLDHGALTTLAIFDKPDPLDGPFFEETIYVTPAALDPADAQAIAAAIARAAAAFGLTHGPIHAECRVNERGVFVLEVAARPIGGLCARALRFERAGDEGPMPLEELLLRHAAGEPLTGWARERAASGVMMIPIPARGVFRTVAGLEEARAVAGVDEVRITAKADQLLRPLPEGASYLGFIFARGDRAEQAIASLRAAHARLAFTIDPEVRVVSAAGRA